MATCRRVIGRYLPHHCNRQIEGPNPPPLTDGRCVACGLPITTAATSPAFDAELDFSAEELVRFGVHLDGTASDGCNPPEWGENSFSGFT